MRLAAGVQEDAAIILITTFHSANPSWLFRERLLQNIMSDFFINILRSEITLTLVIRVCVFSKVCSAVRSGSHTAGTQQD